MPLLFSKLAVPPCVPTNSVQGIQFLHILTNNNKPYWFLLFDRSHLNLCVVASHYSWFTFPQWLVMLTPTHLIISQSKSSLDKCVVKSSTHFWIVCFCCWDLGLFFIFWILILYHIYDLKVFTSILGLVFSLCWCCPFKGFKFDEVQLTNAFFCGLCFWCHV